MLALGDPRAVRSHVHGAIDEAETFKHLIPYLERVPLEQLQNLVHDHVDELKDDDVVSFGLKVISIMDVLPPDLVRHALTFCADFNHDLTSATNKKLLNVNHQFRSLYKEAYYATRIKWYRLVGEEVYLGGSRLEYADFLKSKNRFQEARKQYELSTEQCPHFVKGWTAHANYLRDYAGAEGIDEAIRILQNALTYHPDNADFHETISNLYSDIGRFQDAADHCKTLIDLRPGKADAIVKLARLQAFSANTPESRDYATSLFKHAFQNQKAKFAPQDFLDFATHLIENCGQVVQAAHVLRANITRFVSDKDDLQMVEDVITGDLEPAPLIKPEATRLLLETATVLRHPKLREVNETTGRRNFPATIGDPLALSARHFQFLINIHERGDCSPCSATMQCEVHSEAFRQYGELLSMEIREYRYFLKSLDCFVRAFELAPTQEQRDRTLHTYHDYLVMLEDIGEQLEAQAELWLIKHCEQDDVENFDDWTEEDEKNQEAMMEAPLDDSSQLMPQTPLDMRESTPGKDVGVHPLEKNLVFKEKTPDPVVTTVQDEYEDIYD